MTPASHASLVLVPQYFGALVFDRRTSRYAPFDHESTALLRRAASASFSGAIERERDPERRSALRGFFEHFEREGYFLPDGRFAGAVLDATPPAHHLLGPLAVHLEVIAACNLRCAHCFAGTLPRKADLTLGEMDGLFDELASMGSFRLGLTGGEPLLRRDLVEIVDAATSRGLHPCLTTNGLLLDERVARELGRRKLVWINVSLDGATRETNDAVRGEGTFDAVCAKLRTFGRHMRFTIAFTITSQNAGEVRACAALARELGAHTAVFRPLYPVGVARAHPELMPTFAQYTKALSELSADGHDLSTIDPFGPDARAETQAKTYAPPGCGAANLVASISATGEVSPCSFLGPAFEAGNVRERSFRSIWDRGHTFRRLRGRAGETGCGDGASGFAGGCRARALAAHGDVDAPDPWHDAWVEHSAGRASRPGGVVADPPPLATISLERRRKRLPTLPLVPSGGRSA
jgi:mycofactocin biosynthetic radical S-adenosylmethionine protein MftC